MKEYNLVYAKSFADSLSKLINTWENELFLSPETINKFVGNIQKSLELATVFPEMYEEVSSKYGFSVKTYRIVIGKSYAIFYRIDEKNNNILVGRIFQSKQMKSEF
ncbi:type II toxin-antitoxin system RelE/ParE family toxin [Ligilactobacillus salivarius]|uniref:type II toxin-antitoxin system RelE/ParE family toxin n=1 Tax=Ligilactobacillus salivarius TaxID=1624 RepID=UPI0034DAFDCC